MTYDLNSPYADNSPKMSPTQINTNFNVFGTAISTNHVAMNSTISSQGKHTNVIFKMQSVDPDVNNSYGVIYAKTALQASGNEINLFFRTISVLPNIKNIPQQITFNSIVYTGYTNGAYTNMQQSFIFGGFIVYTGKWTASGRIKTFDVAIGGSSISIPTKLVFATVYYTQTGPSDSYQLPVNINPNPPTTNASTIQVRTAVDGQIYTYFAIGTV